MSHSAEITTTSERQTQAVARRLAARLRGGDVVALYGPLGAGKTCFVRGLAEGLGLDPHSVSSPTFVLCQEYARGSVGLALAHLDGYRITGDDELETLGWDELLEAPDTVIAVEWAERFGARLPAQRVTLELAHDDVDSRTIVIDVPETLADRIDPATLVRPPRTGRCPVCRETVDADADTFPFCSSRCRLVDLGRWFGEGYRMTRPVQDVDDF